MSKKEKRKVLILCKVDSTNKMREFELIDLFDRLIRKAALRT